MSSTFKIAVIDTETTGLYATSDRIVEVAVQLLEVDATGRLRSHVAQYQSLHDPGIRMPWDAMAVHGITDAMVRGHKIDGALLGSLLDRADLVVAHNSGFDKGFVRQVVPHADTLVWGCSCRAIPWKTLYPRMPDIKLPTLARHLRLPTGTAHRAMGDVETTVNLLLREGPNGDPHLALLLHKKLGKKRMAAAGTARTHEKATPAVASQTAETPGEFVLKLFRTHPDREMRSSDVWEEAERKWPRRAIGNALNGLLSIGLVVRVHDAGVTWWSIRA